MLAILFIFTPQGIFGGIPTTDQLPNYKYRPFKKQSFNKRKSYDYRSYLLLPKEAPLNYYSKKHMRKWHTDPITKVNGWIRLWILLKPDAKNSDYFSDIIIFVTDDRTGKKYGRARIIAAQHRKRIVGENREKTIFCVHDKSYLDSINEEKPNWRIIETQNSYTCKDAMEQIIETVLRNTDDIGWSTQNINSTPHSK